jgi:iron(III) transport system permease protein
MTVDTALPQAPEAGRMRPPHYRKPFGVGRESWIQYGTVIVTAVLVLAPVVPTLYQSFVDRPLYEAGGIFTASNYVKLFTQAHFASVALNSLLFAALTTVFALAIAVPLAVLLARTRVPGSRMFATLLQWPIYLSPLVLAFGWILIYGPAGFVSVAVRQVLGFVPWNLYTIPGMAVTEAVALVPLAYLYCSGALAQSDASLENAARVSGAGPLRVLRTVVVPLLRPPILYSALLIFTTSIETLSIPLLYGQPVGIDLFASFLYVNGLVSSNPDYGVLGAASVLTLVITGLLVLLQARLLKNAKRFVAVRGKAARRSTLDLGKLRWVGFAFIAVYLVLGPLLPLLGLVLRAFTSLLTPLISPLKVLTLGNFADVFTFGVYVDSIKNSVIISVVGAIVVGLFISVVVVVARRSTFRLARPLEFLALAPQAIPGIILGIGFFWAFTYLPDAVGSVRATLVALVIVFGVRSFPAAFGAISPVVMQIGDELDSAARSVGADWWRTFTRVLVRLIAPAFLAAFVLLFVQLIKEFTPAVFLATSDTQVIGTTTLEFWTQGKTGAVAALSTIQIAITAVFVLLAGKLLKGKNRA